MSTHDPHSVPATPSPSVSASNAADPLPNPDLLPDDPALLKHLIVSLIKLLRESQHKMQGLAHENLGLQERIHELVGRLLRIPRVKWDPNQLLLFPELKDYLKNQTTADGEVLADAPPPPPPPQPPKSRGKPHGRGRLPGHFERVRVEHALDEAERACPCCGQPREAISTQAREQLDYRPAVFVVCEHVRYTYVCKSCVPGQPPSADMTMSADVETPAEVAAPATCEGGAAPAPPLRAEEQRVLPPHTLTRSPVPAAPIDRGLPGPGLLAYLIVSKFADHLPLYRLESIVSRLGVEIARSTMCDWLAACGELLDPLLDLMRRRLLQSRVIHTDDTTVPLRDETADKHVVSRLWAYLGDRLHPYTVFDYTRTRQRDGPDQFLTDFHGYLQADAFTGYDGLYLDPLRAIREVACWAHARRKFDEARGSEPVRASEALAFIRRLYDVEDQAIEASAGDADRLEAERLRRRQAESRPLLEKFRIWLDAQAEALLPKSKLSEAVRYVMNNWDAFVRYTEDGVTSIDNNVAERALRRVGIGRKNYLFIGADTGGQTAARLYSVIATCERHALDPWRYLNDVLGRLGELRDPLHRARRSNDAAASEALLVPLLPDVWKESHPEAAVPDVHNLGRPHRRR